MANTLYNRSDGRDNLQIRKGRFIPWDGEGITYPGTRAQAYVLFGCPWKRIIRVEPGGLHSIECLDLLESVALLQPNAIHVVYAGSYDFQMIIQDGSVEALARLNRGQRAYIGDYNVEWIPGKMLRWRYEPWDDSIKKHVARASRPWRTLYDVFSFFQTSFVNACETWGIGTEAERAEMREMKSLRADFTTEMFKTQVVPYWKKELAFLEQLMEAFRVELINTDLRITHWFGPGAIASAIYKRHKVKTHADQGVPAYPFVNDAAQCAYAGGRFEQLKIGHVDRAHFYDINSAYPSFIRGLPSLKDARWTLHENVKAYAPARPFCLFDVEFKSWSDARRKREGHRPFPLWARNKRGGIQFGPGVRNWVWTPEYKLLTRYFPDDIKVHRWIEFHPGNPTRPFAWVDDLYLQRLEYKEKGYGAERVLKLALNSLYGKMAQQTGARKTKDGWKIPPYHQLEWAGYVTSATRAMLFHAAMLAPDDVIAFETDAVFSLTPLQLPTGKALGDWGYDELSSLTYVQTGVSWGVIDGKRKEKYRGFDSDSLSEEQVREAWRNGMELVQGSTTRFQSLGSSLHRGDLRSWREWQKATRDLNVFPDRVDGRSLVDRTPLLDGMRPLGIYSKAADPGQGRPYYLEWKNTKEYEQLELSFDDPEEECVI